MTFFLTMAGIWILLSVVLIAIGIGLGYAIQALFPELGFGVSTIIGILGPSIALHFVIRLIGAMNSYSTEGYDAFLVDEMLDSFEKQHSKSSRKKRGK